MIFEAPIFSWLKNTTREPRNSWVLWEEDGRYPDLIIELLSDSTASNDRTLKRDLYAERFHTPEYFYFSPETLEFVGLRLDINRYKPIAPNANGWIWSEVMGMFLGIHDRKLRYFSLEGLLVPTPQEFARNEILNARQEFERAEQERQNAKQERQRAEQESQRANFAEIAFDQERATNQKLVQRLKDLGVEI